MNKKYSETFLLIGPEKVPEPWDDGLQRSVGAAPSVVVEVVLHVVVVGIVTLYQRLNAGDSWNNNFYQITRLRLKMIRIQQNQQLNYKVALVYYSPGGLSPTCTLRRGHLVGFSSSKVYLFIRRK